MAEQCQTLQEEITSWETKCRTLQASREKDDVIDELRTELANRLEEMTMYKGHAQQLADLNADKEQQVQDKNILITEFKVSTHSI